MTQKHSQSFFGASSAMIISSNRMDEKTIFINMIKKKEDKSWESMKEGITIKISLAELSAICDVLSKVKKEWKTVHSFKEKKTSISLSWSEKDGKETLWVNINKYSKPIEYPETNIFRDLADHLYKEKIAHATIPKEKEEEKEVTE